MKDLYFVSSAGERRLVKSGISQEEVLKAIQTYVATLNPEFKIPYIRSWCEDSIWKFDVGSHTEFFEYEGEFSWTV